MTAPRILFVGIGSPHGDDQAGWIVAAMLDDQVDHERLTVRRAKSPTELLHWLDHQDLLLLCDASQGLGQVGAVHRFTWPVPQQLEMSSSGTHDMSLPSVLELAERLGRLPPRVVIWTVEGGTRRGESIAPAVRDALARLVPDIHGEVMRFLSGSSAARKAGGEREEESTHA